MEYLYAALTIHKSGKPVTAATLSAVLKAAGASVDETRVKSLVAALSGVDIDSAHSSAAVMAAAPVAGGVSTAAPAAAPAEKKEEEEAPDESEMGLDSLFG